MHNINRLWSKKDRVMKQLRYSMVLVWLCFFYIYFHCSLDFAFAEDTNSLCDEKIETYRAKLSEIDRHAEVGQEYANSVMQKVREIMSQREDVGEALRYSFIHDSAWWAESHEMYAEHNRKMAWLQAEGVLLVNALAQICKSE